MLMQLADITRFLTAFRRILQTACPGLADESMLLPAQSFLCKQLPREREKISLPWLASFLMILALGQEFQRNQFPDEDGINGEHEHSSSKEPKSFPTGLKYQIGSRRHSELLLSATYQALRLCSFLSSPNLQTIYAQLLIGVYLVYTERAANFWPMLGSIARQAQSIGMHMDPTLFKNASEDERSLRRRLWWTIVQQDVLLSSIFGRPLAVSQFNCRVSSQTTETLSYTHSSRCTAFEQGRTYQEIQSEFSIFARRYINENQFRKWNNAQLQEFKDDLYAWYNDLPEHFSIKLTTSSINTEASLKELRQILIIRSSSLVEQSLDLFMQVQFIILSLYRNRLIRTSKTHENSVCISPTHLQDADGKKPQQGTHVDEISLEMCSTSIHNISIALSSMMDILGIFQAGILWVRIFYLFHAGVTAAYLSLLKPSTTIGGHAAKNLLMLLEVCKRIPQRWDGLRTVKTTFGVLSNLTQAHCQPHRDDPVDPKSPTGPYQSAVHQGASPAIHFFSPANFTSGSENEVSLPSTDLNEWIDMDGMGFPAFNIIKDVPGSGLAPIIDLDYSTDLYDAQDSGTVNYNPEAHNFTNPHGQNVKQLDEPLSRPDKGCPEPFGPMIAPPGPDAPTDEVIDFWRRFFALPF